ncbi:cyclic peptide transporter [Marininema mesophilum]|uniref:Cyclic peptide transporter n=1 Tax=Marininema mesophilum TaxID=1048340 RepID=A0A1H3B192_9BACL|nr:cyclic peptide export ABC transporter [Marininema mesophilum]SDX35726.1 cyclic peptide transporter [Marininema mesophilum]
MRARTVWITLMIIVQLQCIVGVPMAQAAGEDTALSSKEKQRLASFIEEQMDEGKIPGLSVVVVKGDQAVYKKGFGQMDIESKKPVTNKTLFEIGSNSKAYTAAAIYQLAEKGRIDLDKPVSHYLPWFQMRYEGEYQGKKVKKNVDITINQLLHHTSGIPFHTIAKIPVAKDKKALERTVRTLVNQKLDSYPGEKFSYATINYDVLGLVIQKVTHQSFEGYAEKHLVDAFQLNNTYLTREKASRQGMSTGYKISYLQPRAYNAPMYRGNTPAGYFISNADDMEKWLQIQMGIASLKQADKKAIQRTHTADRSVAPDKDGSSYAAGWQSYQNGAGEYSHDGSNPNFSSFIVFRPKEKVGVAVLANLNSTYTHTIGQGIVDILQGKDPKKNTGDIYKSIDSFSFTVILLIIPFICATLTFIGIALRQLFKKQRSLEKRISKVLNVPLFSWLFVLVAGYGLYQIPAVFFSGLSWEFIRVWAPASLPVAVITVFTAIVLFCLYLTFTTIFPAQKEKSFFPLMVLSITSGFGNALIIFIVNEALNRTDQSGSNLFFYFVLGVMVYVLAQKVVRTKLIQLTNTIIYEKRMDLINKILNTPYERIEQMETEKVQTTLNNDTEAISNHAGSLITGLTDSITLICCLVYLGIINIYGLLISIGVILIAAGLYYVAGRSADKLWEQTRNIQNIFFKYLNDLVGGYKELSIGKTKRDQFKGDMQESCLEYKEKRILGGLKFANVFIVGELLFTFVIGAVTFLFPLLFEGGQSESLRSYVFVFLYMTGPINSILNTIPNAVQMKISWKRILDFSNYITELGREPYKGEVLALPSPELKLDLRAVEYEYQGENGEAFRVGPIQCRFTSGEIVFITGGNGSGKSTLAKLITGLYSPVHGEIMMNDQPISPEELGELFSAIYSDYYLFTKMYGIDHQSKQATIDHYLKKLRIDEKLHIENGIFSTTKLSTGQRKRLALLLSYLDEKPIYLFDEWAADQDPEFRRFFYEELLPEFKEKGKCVIAITHDDRYFHLADKVIKMENGQVVEESQANKVPSNY